MGRFYVPEIHFEVGANVTERDDGYNINSSFEVNSVDFKDLTDPFFASYEPQDQLYHVYCVADEIPEEPDDDFVAEVDHPNPGIHDLWVPLVREEVIATELSLLLSQYLEAPDVDFLIREPENGWLFAKVPTEVTVDGVQPVTVFANVANRTGAVSLSITATPVEVFFHSGEPQGGDDPNAMSCSWEQVQNLECMYSYYNASSISESGSFQTTTTVRWAVSTTSGARELFTTATDEVVVAEFNSVVSG